MDDRDARMDLDRATMRGLASSRWLLPIVLLLIVALPRPPLGSTGELRFVLDAPSSWPLVLAGAALFAASELLSRSEWFALRGPARAAMIVLVLDVVALTLVLAGSHAAHNPLTALYFVPLTLATQVSPRATWWVALCAALGFLALFFVPVPASSAHGAAHTAHPEHAAASGAHPGQPGQTGRDEHAHHVHPVVAGGAPAAAAADPFHDHLRGMWIAFAVAGTLLTLSLRRIAFSVAEQRAEVVRLRREADDDRHLAGLASLAAGAAHELGTPLQNIGLLLDEVEGASPSERREAIDDVRAELERCKQILRTIASPEIAISGLGQELAAWDLRSLAVELEDAAQGSITVDASALSAATVSTDIPREIVGQILRELVNNAVVACASIGGARTVRVTAALLGRNIDDVESPDSRGRTEHRPRGEAFVCTIEDDGPGIPSDDLERVFRPFQSSHASHRGLGLFIARAQVRRLGGALDLLPREGGGTIARVRLPASLVTTASGRRAAPHGPATPTPGSTPTALTREQEAL